MKTVIISFSSRTNGNCDQIGKMLQSMIEDSKRFSFTEFSIHPCGNCHYECFKKREQCPYINDMEYKLLESIMQSEMTYFILPNYCDYPCANYFIFNERSQCFFQGKPELCEVYLKTPKRCIVVSNTNTDNFVRAAADQAEKKPDMLFLSAAKYGKISIDGNLLTSEKAMSDIREFITK